MYADLRGRFGTRSDESATRLQAEIARCISAIGDEQQPGAAGGSSPDEANTALMFRTFSAAANRIKAENEKLKEARLCPSCSPEWRNSDSLLVEFSAVESNLFRLRVVTAVFSLVVFAVMMNVDGVTQVHYEPYAQSWSWWYQNTSVCDGPYFQTGQFPMKPYLMVLVVAGLCGAYSAGMAAYYLLPMNAAREKYIPGLRQLVEHCVTHEEDAAAVLGSRLPDCITARLPTAALLLDHGLAALALAAFVRATVALQTPNKFVMDYKVQEYLEGGGTQWRDVRAESYYTIATFYRTFHGCGVKDDPTDKIQAALAVLFLAVCALSLRLVLCWRRRSSLPPPVETDEVGAEEGAGEAFLSTAAAPSVSEETEEAAEERNEMGDETTA